MILYNREKGKGVYIVSYIKGLFRCVGGFLGVRGGFPVFLVFCHLTRWFSMGFSFYGSFPDFPLDCSQVNETTENLE